MKNVFLLIATLVALVSQAQQNNKVKLYAYHQAGVPGIQKARDIDENGNRLPAKKAEGQGNYMIYAVSTSTARVYPVELWINGKRHGVKMKTIARAPVTYKNPSTPDKANPVVLVPRTNGKILQLLPTDAFADKIYPAAEKLAGHNELVFVFKQGGKFYYQPLQKLVSLDAVNLQ